MAHDPGIGSGLGRILRWDDYTVETASHRQQTLVRLHA